jgi:serine/threonine protein kinase
LTKQKERALRRELELTGSLHLQLTEMEQENIVKYLGFEVFEGKLVMVMEYIKGGNLRSLIGEDGRRKHIGTKRSIKLMLGLLNGLDIIHKKHIIHRDIKPENILMDGDVPKITDLGIGRMLRPDELAYTKGVGTLFYIPPEILYGRFGASYTYNADIWSVGIMFYEMLCCQFPFGMTCAMSMGVITDLIKDDDVQLVFPSEELVPLQLQAIIAKALRRNPAERYKTAGEILKDLKEFLRGSDEAVESEIGLIQQLILDPAQSRQAESKLCELRERFPDSPRIYLHLGEFYNRQGNFGKAIQVLNEGVEKDPQNSVFYWDLAIAHDKKGNVRLAIESLEKALAFGLEGSLERYARSLLKTLEKKA